MAQETRAKAYDQAEWVDICELAPVPSTVARAEASELTMCGRYDLSATPQQIRDLSGSRADVARRAGFSSSN
jgi:hypothetical protein